LAVLIWLKLLLAPAPVVRECACIPSQSREKTDYDWKIRFGFVQLPEIARPTDD
jgi:hypothetical protein